MAYHESLAVWKPLLDAGLEDDGWQWDWTSLGLGPARGAKRVRARVVAKSDGVWAATGLTEALEAYGVKARSLARDGTVLKPGRTCAEITGPARLVLALERPFLNLASYTCGVATATRRMVEAARKACPRQTPRVTATRKTLPGYRDAAILGLLAGGGHSHRVSLAGGVLIKENHIAAAGGIRAAVEGARAVAPHGLKIELEVTDLKELREAIAQGADVVMLDNFAPALVRRALDIVGRAPRRPVVEVSGGIHEGNVADYAIPGVDVISSGSLTHSVRGTDLSLLL